MNNDEYINPPAALAISWSEDAETLVGLLGQDDAEDAKRVTFCDWGDRLGWYFTYMGGTYAMWMGDGRNGIMSPDEREVIAYCYQNAQVRQLKR